MPTNHIAHEFSNQPRKTCLATLILGISLAVSAPVQAQSEDKEPPNEVGMQGGTIEIEELATLEFPWGMAILPGNRMLITEKPGNLRVWSDGELSDPVKGVPEVHYEGSGDQGGLLDVILDPEFDSNNRIYLSYTEAADKQPEDLRDTKDVRFADYIDTSRSTLRGGAVARATLDGNQLKDVEVIWRQEPKTIGRGHFGHRMVFGPDDKLFIMSGDRMRFEPAQNLNTNLGKVIRINRDGSNPEDNPSFDEEDARGDIWSYGHRNILAAAFDPETDKLWTFEMGPLGGDEVNLIEKGKNYGWPTVSNGAQYNRDPIPGHPGTDEFEDPIRTWTPVVSPSGAMFYDGTLIPEWQGSLLVGGLSSKSIVRLELDDERIAVEERIDMQRRIRDLKQAPDGSIYALVDAEEGKLLRLIPERTDAGRPVAAPEAEEDAQN
ncbi:PQQ-dependent sugar dehydrogenase [Marinobacter salicampi]|uniref:PQQ-dependent sugar dehydrogenase n=1 Tax=Marinobacter salicampi TaxID=435907 RepID=UPI001A9424E3|nr:PQQ-dependent sugar dehydrogenase [Marinobacter salicampi]